MRKSREHGSVGEVSLERSSSVKYESWVGKSLENGSVEVVSLELNSLKHEKRNPRYVSPSNTVPSKKFPYNAA